MRIRDIRASESALAREINTAIEKVTAQLLATGRARTVTEDIVTDYWFDENGELAVRTQARWDTT